MEAKISGKSPLLYNPAVVSDLKSVGKKSLEWDLNDWKWDGDLFAATPLNSVPSECRSKQLFPIGPEIPLCIGGANSSSSFSDDNNLENGKGEREVEKRRRVDVVGNEELNNEGSSLNLKLGGQAYPIIDDDVKCGKKTKVGGTASNRAACQVEDCKADLSNAKDYHRRHKVCELHSKATKALVGNVMQRFCQQCSRFHALEEFDEGKRSCRRRLAGHNKRRRKTHPENAVNGGASNEEKGSSYLLISLLRILANLHANSSDQTKDQDLLSHLLSNLGNLASTANGRSLSHLLQGSQGSPNNAGTTVGSVEKVSGVITKCIESNEPSGSASKRDYATTSQNQLKPLEQCGTLPVSDMVQGGNGNLHGLSGWQSTALFRSRQNLPPRENESEISVRRSKLNDIDLNNVYDEKQDYVENQGKPLAPVNCPFWVQSDFHEKSQLQKSCNSDSTSSQSPSTSSGEAQRCTDRIVFKLFGKDPSDFPTALRTQILDWLSHSPTDIESYIRPGCIILTIYLRLEKPKWEEICLDLGASLSRLLETSDDLFWRTGWIYVRVRHCLSFIYDGQVVLDTPLPMMSHKNCRISSIKPIAVSLLENTEFVVSGFNIFRPTTRVLCALEGNYLVQESCYDLMGTADGTIEHDKLQSFSFSCSGLDFVGRGFIEVEDHGLCSSFFPFIVAEKEVCAEICALEDAIQIAAITDDVHKKVEIMEARNQALDFIHEMGWLLHRSRVKLRLGHLHSKLDLFPLNRFKWLIEFSMDRDWCAVVKKLLAIIFDGTVDPGEHSSIQHALVNMGLLHKAVRRNCKSMVELLLRYAPERPLDRGGLEEQVDCGNSFIFKPDVVGPAGLTPLHVAAVMDGSENVLDALTDDPGSVGIQAWKSARDSTGLTPNDYACIRGHYSYIHLVQRKIDEKSESSHVVVDIPDTLQGCNPKKKDALKLLKIGSLEMEKVKTKATREQCRVCEQRVVMGMRRTSLVYKPAMLSMVAIAAVCVCVALLFKSSPEVLCVFRPFRWELLKYGSS